MRPSLPLLFLSFGTLVLLQSPAALAHTTGDHIDHIEADRQAALEAETAVVFEVPPQQPVAAEDRQTLGEWSAIIAWPHIPVSAAILIDGRVLTWASSQRDAFPGGDPEFTYAATWDPLDGNFVDVPHDSHDMFCSHQVGLGDGRIFVSGGRNHVRTTSVFDPQTDNWTVIEPMNRGRWYPSSVFLSDGGVFTALGSSGGEYPEVWHEGAGWRLLTGIDFTTPVINFTAHYEQIWWPFFVQTPLGDLFHYGPTPTMHRLDLTGSGSMQELGTLNENWYPKHGASVLYDVGKVLVAGGAIAGGNLASSGRAMVIDVNGFAPIVREIPGMAHARKFHNAIALPNGEVLVVGGNTSGAKFDDAGTVLIAEAWNPVTESWRELTAASVPRNYHSIALLLTDGRVLSGGGGLCGSCAANHQDAQVYSPGYLFNADGSLATRPVVSTAPAIVDLDTTFNVAAEAGIARFTLVKSSTTTHAVNTDQRFLEVAFSEISPGSYLMALPSNPHVLAPGIYMLFAINSQGVPSIARMVRVRHPAATGPPIGPTHRYFKLVGLSEVNANPWSAVAELNLLDGQGTAIPRTSWSPSADSEETSGEDGRAVNAIDGDPATHWHTEWQASSPPPPHELVIDLGADESLSAFVYTPRQNSANGRIADYEAYVSSDGVAWGSPVALGTFVDGATDHTVSLATGAADGLAYEYFEGSWNALPDFDLLTPVATGSVSTFDISPRLRDEQFGFRFRGRIRIDTGGTYTFFTNSDDGSQLFINDVLVVQNDGLHGPAEQSGSASLAAGEHDIAVTFFEQGGGELLVASFEGPGVPKQSIPASQFGPLPVGANLAIGRQPSQSSTSSGAGSERAVDGNRDGNLSAGSVARTQDELQPWWEVDLGQVWPLDSVRLWNRTDCCGAELTDFHVLVSDVSFASSDLTATQLQAGVDDFPHPGPADDDTLIPVRRSGRYVRVQLSGTGTLALAEIEILLGAEQPLVPDPISVVANPTAPAVAGTEVTLSVAISGGDNPVVSWDFGDGTPPTAATAGDSAVHTYVAPGRYLPRATVTDDAAQLASTALVQHVHLPLLAGAPDASTPIRWLPRAGGDVVVNVNPDNDSISWHAAGDLAPLGEVSVGRGPRALAEAPDGTVWVTNKLDATISAVDLDLGTVVDTFALPPASRPHGLVFAPDGSRAFAALEAIGEVLALDPVDASILGSVDVGRHVRHLSITAGGNALFASRFVTPKLDGENTPNVETEIGQIVLGGEVLVIDPGSMAMTDVIVLEHHDTIDAANDARGVPNYLGAAALSPDGVYAWVPSKQDNLKRGTGRDGLPLTHDTTVRAITSRLDLTNGLEIHADRIDHDDSGVASAAVYDPTGNLLYVALENTRQVSVVDAFGALEIARIPVDRAPQGLALSPDGLTLFVYNFMERSVSRHDLSGMVQLNDTLIPRTHTAATVSSEKLAPDVLLGKQFFYDTGDTRLAFQGYLSCASCHNEGAGDGRTWDFTQFGEGLRNTIDLRGRGRPGHGPLHWTANFDEVQDFEGQIRGFALGSGLMSDADFNSGSHSASLGDPKAGLSSDLDALAAYVLSLDETPESPYRDADGTLSTEAAYWRSAFKVRGCATCHTGDEFTDSQTGVRHDVGTTLPASGQRLNGPLDGFDTPSLKGVWGSGPYLHDGRAETLEDAVAAHIPAPLTAEELAGLAHYLREIDDREFAPRPRVVRNRCGLGCEVAVGLLLLGALRARRRTGGTGGTGRAGALNQAPRDRRETRRRRSRPRRAATRFPANRA